MELLDIEKGERIRDPLCDDPLNWEAGPEEDPAAHLEFRTKTQGLTRDRNQLSAIRYVAKVGY